MIYLLRGIIAEKAVGKIVLDVHGVGYGVTTPLSTYYRLPETGAEAELKIHTQVKEDAIDLYGFLTEDERKIFLALIGVSGVGARVAGNILSSVSPVEIAALISSGEITKKKIPGIGAKLASRLVTELKDKMPKLQLSGGGDGTPETKHGILGDVISALLNLGYTKPEIDERILQIEEAAAGDRSIEGALRESLKIMRRG
ncbi:MAG: Holliday junction branch migration protein RuvA [Deltaproteobacteria bacterium]